MSAMASQITSLTIVYSIVYSGADQRKHQSSASLAFVRGIHRWPVNSQHKGPVTRKNVSIWWRHYGKQIWYCNWLWGCGLHRGCCNAGFSSETFLKLNFGEVLFAYNVLHSCQIVSKFCAALLSCSVQIFKTILQLKWVLWVKDISQDSGSKRRRTALSATASGPRLNTKTVFPGMAICIIKIRRSWGRLIFAVGIRILIRHLKIETPTPSPDRQSELVVTGHVTLMIITVITNLVPHQLAKSRQFIWWSGTSKFQLPASDLQMSCSNVIRYQVSISEIHTVTS